MFIGPASFTRYILGSKIFRCKILVTAKMQKFRLFSPLNITCKVSHFGHDILLLTGNRNKLQ